jgi:predicted dehydrogenase
VSSAPVRVVLVGAGHRGLAYCRYQREHPDQLQVCAVVDPNPTRRRAAADEFGIARSGQFASLADLPAAGTVADAAVDATMDAEHVPTASRLLEAGYDVLLEKPIAPSAAGLLRLAELTRALERTLMICHVLRYAPFYVDVKRRIAAGEIGEVQSIEMAEHVAYHHMAVSFVRGRWGNSARSGSGLLLAKSCHDLDVLAWLMNATVPVRVASAGARAYFRPERAPAGAGTRCLTDCAIEPSCPYSARRNYVEQELWPFYAGEGLESNGPAATSEQRLESLRTDNPYGRCVWRSDNDVVDRQSVLIDFADGATGTFTLTGTAARPNRTLHVVGSAGEISGVLEDGELVIRRFGPDERGRLPAETMRTDRVQIADTADSHGGGDLRLVADFVRTVRGEPPSPSSTAIADSVNGHLLVYAAELARTQQRWVSLTEFAAA